MIRPVTKEARKHMKKVDGNKDVALFVVNLIGAFLATLLFSGIVIVAYYTWL